jgi:hypothetical protein
MKLLRRIRIRGLRIKGFEDFKGFRGRVEMCAFIGDSEVEVPGVGF